MRKLPGFIAACAVIMFGFLSLRALPVETGQYIAKKYAGWSGVIRCWICADFSCAGSFNSWLNSCAAAFERDHPGVYVEIETVSAPVMASRGSARLPPDMIFYSPSVTDSENLTCVTLLALGAAAGVYRADARFDPAVCAIGTDPCRDAAAAAILIGRGEAERAPAENSGVDLGLPAAASAVSADDALQAFLDGRADCAVVTSAQLARLIERRERGLPPDWRCADADIPFTDQLLLGAACCEGEKRDVCCALLSHLTTDACQRRLSEIGAHSPLMRIYPDASPYAAADAALARPDRIIAAPEKCGRIDCADVLRRLQSGQTALPDAQAAVVERYNY